MTQPQINAMIESLMFYSRNHAPSETSELAESVLGYLIEFHTKRWGLPAAIKGHASQATPRRVGRMAGERPRRS
jgi:hypothetical protein